MPKRLFSRLLLLMVLLPTPLLAQLRFAEGRHYDLISTPQTTGLAPAGRIEVAEVFSYVCGACNSIHPLAEGLKKGLPADAAFVLVHAGFQQNWPTFQRAHLTAQQLGIADRNHLRMFAAIWETGALPYFDKATGRPKQPAPTVADLARFYVQGGGVKEADFLQRAASPQVDAAVKRSEALIKGWQIGGTPAFVVAGRYRINNDAVTTLSDLQALVAYLVGLERSRLAKAAKPAR